MAKYKEWATEEGLLKLQRWARSGLTDEQIANNMGINTATLYRWKSQFCEIREALKKGKEVADIQVENALFKRACGYEYEEERFQAVTDPETGETVLRAVGAIKKHQPPDTTAAIFWLKNRLPDRWRDGKNLEVAHSNIPKGDFDIVLHVSEDGEGDGWSEIVEKRPL